MILIVNGLKSQINQNINNIIVKRKQVIKMFLQGLDGLDLILLVAFFYVSYKLYKRAKKEKDNEK
jgi:hypothetical protein